MERSYFYLGGDPLHTGIYVDLIRRLEQEGLAVGLVSRLRTSPDPRGRARARRECGWLGPNRIEDVRAGLRGPVHQLPVWNLAPGLAAPALARLVDAGAADRAIVLHTRQIVMARLALALKRRHANVRVIAELEGDDLAEVRYRRAGAASRAPWDRLRWAFEHRYYDTADRRILLESDHVLCVSGKLREVLARRYSLAPSFTARMSVFPTLASDRTFRFDPAAREEVRSRLGLAERYVVLYSGNLRGRWQVPDRLVEAFTMIRSARSDAFFLVLTSDSDRACIEPHLRAAGVPADAHRILSVPHDQVAAHLCAADVGLLLRERDPMNEVAAPGKFSEYALSGLPLVMTEGIGDFSEAMGGRATACVLPGIEDRGHMREALHAFCRREVTPEERAEFGAWSAQRFSIDRVVPGLAELYRTV